MDTPCRVIRIDKFGPNDLLTKEDAMRELFLSERTFDRKSLRIPAARGWAPIRYRWADLLAVFWFDARPAAPEPLTRAA
jgi:hypothetical protein